MGVDTVAQASGDELAKLAVEMQLYKRCRTRLDDHLQAHTRNITSVPQLEIPATTASINPPKHSTVPSPQLTTFPTFQRRLLSPEGIPNSRASRLSCRQRSHRLTFLSSGGGGGPITAFTADADAGPEDDDDDDDDDGTLSFRANSS